MRKLVLLPILLLTACNSEIYTRDGVTDGDTFYLAPRAYEEDDPVLQSWVAYSLIKSTCQLSVGGEIPARVSDYGCEFTARQHLLDIVARVHHLPLYSASRLSSTSVCRAVSCIRHCAVAGPCPVPPPHCARS